MTNTSIPKEHTTYKIPTNFRNPTVNANTHTHTHTGIDTLIETTANQYSEL